jgi:hypothetical protein
VQRASVSKTCEKQNYPFAVKKKTKQLNSKSERLLFIDRYYSTRVLFSSRKFSRIKIKMHVAYVLTALHVNCVILFDKSL